MLPPLLTQNANPSAPLGVETEAPLHRAERAVEAGRFGEADGICRDILAGNPEDAGALGLLGAVAGLRGRLGEALALTERAIRRDPEKSRWYGNLCEFYRLGYRLDEALAAGREALRVSPNTGVLTRLAQVHVDRGEFDEALRHYLAVLGLDPKDPGAHLGIGQILLARGEFRSGWIEYEWRNLMPQAPKLGHFRAPAWNGMNVPNGRIMLLADQGYGDAIQFCRYIGMVAERCGEVLLGTSPNLKALFARLPGVRFCFSEWQHCPPFTAYALLSSLPYVFGTELPSIPAPVPYLDTDPEKGASWRARLAAQTSPGRPRVGLFWSGRPAHPNNWRRSLNLSQLAELTAVPDVHFVSLQKEVPGHDAAALAGLGNILDLGPQTADFDDTAAIIDGLDLVVTIDSAVAHLAGALGKPVWVLMPRPADFRWLLDRDDSPWYPTMRLFRQPRPGAWPEAIAAAAAALAGWARAGAGS